ncbi:MAG: membrane protein insertase YidC, partial [Thermoanaerobaculum sp.]
MERRALLAVLLSVVAVVVWYSLFPPPQPVPAELEKSAPTPTRASEVGAPVETAGLPAEGEAVAGDREEQVVLGDEGFRVVVSNRGGVVVSLQLSAFQDEKGNPQELVGASTPPLALVPDGPWNRELYRVERDGNKVSLRWSDGRGHLVEKRLWVEGPYRLRVEGKALGFGQEVGVVVGSLATWAGVGKSDSLGRADLVVASSGKLKRVTVGKADKVEAAGVVAFVGAEDRYFLLAFLPEQATGGRVEGVEGRAVVVTTGEFSGTLVGAPKEHKLLKSFGRGLEETLSFGLFGFLSLLFLEVLRWIYGWSGNWGVGIIVLTALIRVLLFPLTHKSTVAMRGMAKLQPKIKAIQ